MKYALVIPTWDPPRAIDLMCRIRDTMDPCDELDVSIIGPRDGEYFGAIEAMAMGVKNLLQPASYYDWIIFLHDDVEIHESSDCWLEWFNAVDNISPNLGLIGFGGARGLGDKDLYKYPMTDINRLARHGYVSNTTDAEVHGERTKFPVANLATLDGFCLILRGRLYSECSWDKCLADGFIFHGYDHWLSLRVRELGYSVGMLPVSCTHHGGGTEVRLGDVYRRWCESRGLTPEQIHYDSHQLLYDRFRNILPIV